MVASLSFFICMRGIGLHNQSRSGEALLQPSPLFPPHAPEQEVFAVAMQLMHTKDFWLNHEQYSVIVLALPILASLYAKALECNDDLGLPARYGWVDRAGNAAQSSVSCYTRARVA